MKGIKLYDFLRKLINSNYFAVHGSYPVTTPSIDGGNKLLKTTENKKKITDIIHYINGLNLKKTSEDVSKYLGMAYVITLHFSDKTSKEYIHYGNRFFRESGKDWYEIPYEQADKFNSIYKNLNNK